jgi:hypothetical protein
MTALPSRLADDWTDLLRLLGEHALMLHAPDPRSDLSGTDYDCAVFNLDHQWPLRLTGGWSLCQCVHYDLLAWYWILERDGEVFALDTVVDPEGLGRDGFPTKLFLQGDELAASPSVRAAYLTAKRIRKGMLNEPEWQRIGSLAHKDDRGYHAALKAVVGTRLARLVSSAALQGRPPDAKIWKHAHRLQLLRRVRTPRRLASALGYGLRRTTERVMHPTGLVVLVAGPDGAGKSTLAEQLPEICSGLFRRDAHFHWRPGLLPRPGAFFGRAGPDPTDPHGREPHGRVVSNALLLYFWADFLLGSWARFAIPRIRSGLVVVERGWFDIGADPRRYRLDCSPSLVRRLSRTIPRADIALVLDARAETLVSRKQELPAPEINRQLQYWRNASVAKLATWHIDTERDPDSAASAARTHIVATLEQQTASRLGLGWLNIGRRANPRFYLPRGDRRTASAALALYQPLSDRARRTWTAAQAIARLGGFRFLPRGKAPPLAVRAALAPYLLPFSSVAIARMTHPNRYVAAILDRTARPRMIAKIAVDDEGVRHLAAEASALAELSPLLPPPLTAPALIEKDRGVLVFDFVPWVVRSDVANLPLEVAAALGEFFRSGRTSDGRGPTHGDFAPWNLLRTTRGWTLIDWEAASPQGEPFTDVCHFFVQSHVLLGRPSDLDIVAGFKHGHGPVGAAVRAYADAAELPFEQAAPALQSYLSTSAGKLLPHDRERGARARDRLLRKMDR